MHASDTVSGLFAETVIGANAFRTVTDIREYNPLSIDELGKNAVRRLMEYPSIDLPPERSFNGVGVYTIHYHGAFLAYKGIGASEPIYVGKAESPGKRQGRQPAKRSSPVLYRRLSEHAQSIASVENLDLRDFRCRWLVLDPIWIGLTEQVLIAAYRPIWNAVVDGFGNHDPGSGRQKQRRSSWDTLHPGRKWATRLRESTYDIPAICDKIESHRQQGSASLPPL